MFQKKFFDMSKSTKDIKEVGDFFLQLNRELTTNTIVEFAHNPLAFYLLEQSLGWYKRPPEEIPNKWPHLNKDGENVDLILDNTHIGEMW